MATEESVIPHPDKEYGAKDVFLDYTGRVYFRVVDMAAAATVVGAAVLVKHFVTKDNLRTLLGAD